MLNSDGPVRTKEEHSAATRLAIRNAIEAGRKSQLLVPERQDSAGYKLLPLSEATGSGDISADGGFHCVRPREGHAHHSVQHHEPGALHAADVSRRGTFIDGHKIPQNLPTLLQTGSVLSMVAAEEKISVPLFRLAVHSASVKTACEATRAAVRPGWPWPFGRDELDAVLLHAAPTSLSTLAAVSREWRDAVEWRRVMLTVEAWSMGLQELKQFNKVLTRRS
eukprot:5839654-Prymnesium_polylepis.1